MHVIAHGFEVTVAAAVHDERLVPSAEEVTEFPVSAIEARSVRAQQPFHAGDQVGLRCFDHQVKVVGHETVGMDLPTGLLAGLAQGGEKALAVLVIRVNVLPPVTPVHDVVNGTRVLDS